MRACTIKDASACELEVERRSTLKPPRAQRTGTLAADDASPLHCASSMGTRLKSMRAAARSCPAANRSTNRSPVRSSLAVRRGEILLRDVCEYQDSSEYQDSRIYPLKKSKFTNSSHPFWYCLCVGPSLELILAKLFGQREQQEARIFRGESCARGNLGRVRRELGW